MKGIEYTFLLVRLFVPLNVWMLCKIRFCVDSFYSTQSDLKRYFDILTFSEQIFCPVTCVWELQWSRRPSRKVVFSLTYRRQVPVIFGYDVGKTFLFNLILKFFNSVTSLLCFVPPKFMLYFNCVQTCDPTYRIYRKVYRMLGRLK